MAGFATHGLDFYVGSPDALEDDTWREIQAVEREAFANELLDRPQADIDYLIDWDDPEAFRASRLDPQEAVRRGRLYKDQSFRKPLVALAANEDRVVGYAYMADNTSGNFVERQIKMLGVAKRYAWLREIAVLPEYQHRGIAHVLTYLSLERRDSLQPVTAYVWEENASARGLLHSFGFERSPQDQVPADFKAFGEYARPAKMYRLAAKSASLVLLKILTNPGAYSAIKAVKNT